MMTSIRQRPHGRHSIAAAVLLMGLLAAACGGGSTRPAATATESAAPVETAAGPALPLTAFHYSITLTMTEEAGTPGEVVVTTEGDFQAPDRHAFSHSVALGPNVLTRRAVVIGDQVWYRRAALRWRLTTTDDAEAADLFAAAFTTLRPEFLGGPAFDKVRESVRRLQGTNEDVNGVPATRYAVSAAGRPFFDTFLEPAELLQSLDGVTWDLWLAREGGWPVRLLVAATEPDGVERLDLEGAVDWKLRIDVSRPDDPAISVVAPDTGG